jgi:hypothetical protein
MLVISPQFYEDINQVYPLYPHVVLSFNDNLILRYGTPGFIGFYALLLATVFAVIYSLARYTEKRYQICIVEVLSDAVKELKKRATNK